MAKRIFSTKNWTPTATADTVAHANATYMALRGGTATQMLKIAEVMAAGMVPSTSSPTFLELCLTSTVETTPTALAAPTSDGPMHISSAALAVVPVSLVAAAAGPQRAASTAFPRLQVGVNAWGGILRWTAMHEEEFVLIGNAANGGEAILSAFTGGTPGAINSHIVYEPL